MPCVRFGECCFTQATHGIRCNVSASIDRLVVAQLFGYLPFRFSTHCSQAMTNALLRMASMVNDSDEDFKVLWYTFDATQGFCYGGFEAKLCTCILCSSAVCGNLDCASRCSFVCIVGADTSFGVLCNSTACRRFGCIFQFQGTLCYCHRELLLDSFHGAITFLGSQLHSPWLAQVPYITLISFLKNLRCIDQFSCVVSRNCIKFCRDGLHGRHGFCFCCDVLCSIIGFVCRDAALHWRTILCVLRCCDCIRWGVLCLLCRWAHGGSSLPGCARFCLWSFSKSWH